MSAIFLGNPARIFKSDGLIPVYLLSFCLIHFLPFSHTLLTRLAPLSTLFLDCFVDGISRTLAMTAFVDIVRGMGGGYFGQIFIGFWSVTGGGQ